MGFLMLTALFHIRAYAGGWRPEPSCLAFVFAVVVVVIVLVVLGSVKNNDGPPRGGLRA